MILAYLLSAVVGVVIFFVASKLSLPMRLGLSIGIFVLLAVIVTVIIIRVGDRASPDAVTIDPKRLQEHGEDK
jgi:hypothetical protein